VESLDFFECSIGFDAPFAVPRTVFGS